MEGEPGVEQKEKERERGRSEHVASCCYSSLWDLLSTFQTVHTNAGASAGYVRPGGVAERSYAACALSPEGGKQASPSRDFLFVCVLGHNLEDKSLAAPAEGGVGCGLLGASSYR